MSTHSEPSEEKRLAMDGVSMATLLPASLHPQERLWISREALVSVAACQTHYPAKNKTKVGRRVTLSGKILQLHFVHMLTAILQHVCFASLAI